MCLNSLYKIYYLRRNESFYFANIRYGVLPKYNVDNDYLETPDQFIVWLKGPAKTIKINYINGKTGKSYIKGIEDFFDSENFKAFLEQELRKICTVDMLNNKQNLLFSLIMDVKPNIDEQNLKCFLDQKVDDVYKPIVIDSVEQQEDSAKICKFSFYGRFLSTNLVIERCEKLFKDLKEKYQTESMIMRITPTTTKKIADLKKKPYLLAYNKRLRTQKYSGCSNDTGIKKNKKAKRVGKKDSIPISKKRKRFRKDKSCNFGLPAKKLKTQQEVVAEEAVGSDFISDEIAVSNLIVDDYNIDFDQISYECKDLIDCVLQDTEMFY